MWNLRTILAFVSFSLIGCDPPVEEDESAFDLPEDDGRIVSVASGDQPGAEGIVSIGSGSTGVKLVIITSVALPPPGYYKPGDTMLFTVTFDNEVRVKETPRMGFTAGSTVLYANYTGGSHSTSLTFEYTVQAGDLDLDGIAMSSEIDLNGGSITDSSKKYDAVLTYTSPDSSNIWLDGVGPTASSLSTPDHYSYGPFNPMDFVVTFNEAVFITGTPQLSINVNGSGATADYYSGSGTTAITFRNSDLILQLTSLSMTSPLSLNGGTIKDAHGNAATSLAFTAGGIAVVSSVTKPSDGTYAATDNLDFIVNFSDDVTVTGSPIFPVLVGENLRDATYQSGSGTSALTFRYTIQASENDNDGGIAGTELNLNGGTIVGTDDGFPAIIKWDPIDTTGIIIDTGSPSVDSVTATDGAYSSTKPMDFTVTFTESVEVTGTPRISINVNSTAQHATYYSGSGTNTLIFRYAIATDEFEPEVGSTISSPIDLNGGTIADGAGNASSLTFTAPDISGMVKAWPELVLWLDADDSATVTTSSGDVTDWNDKSGGSNHASQPTADQRPEYRTDSPGPWTKNVVEFSGVFNSSTTGLSDIVPLSDDCTIFIAFSIDAVTNYGVLFDLNKNTLSDLFMPTYFSTSGAIGTTGSWPVTAFTTPFSTTGTKYLGTFIYETDPSNATRVYDDGVESTSIANNGTVKTGFGLGTGGYWPAFNGFVAEVMVFDKVLSSSEQDDVEAYLRTKWGI